MRQQRLLFLHHNSSRHYWNYPRIPIFQDPRGRLYFYAGLAGFSSVVLVYPLLLVVAAETPPSSQQPLVDSGTPATSHWHSVSLWIGSRLDRDWIGIRSNITMSSLSIAEQPRLDASHTRWSQEMRLKFTWQIFLFRTLRSSIYIYS